MTELTEQLRNLELQQQELRKVLATDPDNKLARSMLMGNRLGEEGLRSLNKEAARLKSQKPDYGRPLIGRPIADEKTQGGNPI